jgi:hypothetical protein
MRKIILTITAIVCLLTPTYAREWNQENLATVAATIAYYHENCGDVPPKGLAAANAVAEGPQRHDGRDHERSVYGGSRWTGGIL